MRFWPRAAFSRSNLIRKLALPADDVLKEVFHFERASIN
jgi:hypothetical protein